MNKTQSVPQLTRISLRDQAYALIRQWIITGRLAPGTPVSERSIAEQLGVSRAPIKDALLRLTREGFVVARPDGRYVNDLGPEEIEQVYLVRERLECLAAELAARNASPSRTSALRAKIEEYRSACQAKDLDAFVTVDVDIHTMIWEQAGNPYLLNALNCIAAPTFMHVANCSRFVDEQWSAPLREHEEIVRLIAEGDAAGAGEAMVGHVRSAYARTIRALREGKGDGRDAERFQDRTQEPALSESDG